MATVQADGSISTVSKSWTSRPPSTRRRSNPDAVGASGPIGAHTPEVCYGGLGYKCVGKPLPTRVTFANEAAGFWTARFEKERTAGEGLRVYWAWSTDGNWEASSDPRTEFALRTVLYKAYVVHQSPKPDSPDPTAGFLAEFLPVVKTALSGTPVDAVASYP